MVELENAREDLIEQIRTRFHDVVNSGTERSNPLFLAAAFIDPTVNYLLNNKRELGERALVSMVNQWIFK